MLNIFIKTSIFVIQVITAYYLAIERSEGDIQVHPCAEETNRTLHIKWHTTPRNACVTSDPPCIGIHKEIMKRCCGHRGWDIPPDCVSVQNQDLPACPENFHHYQGKELCYKFTEKTKFPPKCPNKHVVPFERVRVIINEMLHEPVWMPVTRDFSNGVGFLRWTEFSHNYKKVFDESVSNPNNLTLSDMNCLTYHKKSYILASCTSYYKGICAYSKLDNSMSYCRKQKPVCRQKDYSDPNRCLCVQYSSSGASGQPTVPLAELIDPYQNQIVKSITADKCLIGLKRMNAHEYVWMNSKSNINYTYWSIDVDYNPTHTSGVLTLQGWILKPEDDDYACFIHEDVVELNKPTLKLTYDGDAFKLDIKHKNDLIDLEENPKVQVICFTDATDSSEIIDRYPVVEGAETTLRFPKPAAYGPGHYWCEAVNYGNFETVKSEKLFYNPPGLYGCEFVAVVECKGIDALSPEKVEWILILFRDSVPHFYVRVFKILGIKEPATIILNVHFTQIRGHFHPNCIEIYKILKTRLEKLIDHRIPLKIPFLYSTDFCMETQVNNVSWPTTAIHSYAYSNELCLTNKLKLIKRHCRGNFTDGAIWEDIEVNCILPNISSATDELYNLLNQHLKPEEIINGLYNITFHYKNYSSLDIYLISEILGIVENIPNNNLQQLLETISLLNVLDRPTFRAAQHDFNATDRILLSLDDIFSNVTMLANETHIKFTSTNTLLMGYNIASTSVMIGGVILVKNGETYDLKILEKSEDLSKYMNDSSLEAAVIIPRSLQEQIRRNMSGGESKIIFAVYLLDTLFNSGKNNRSKDGNVSQIFDILIPGFEQEFSEPLQIFYKAKSREANDTCVYWYFGQQSSFWKNDTKPLPVKKYERCDFVHVTHFALLLVDDPAIEDLNFHHALDIITDINCILSLFGLLAILLTAILFKRWRTNVGNRILINFVFAISLQISLLYISDSIHKYVKLNDLCTVVGALLQYSIISEFCWMLISAILQFKRFVEVFGGQPKYMMLKACAIGWILPLFPVLCVLFLDPKSYVKNKVGLCYPSGLSLYLSIWLPVGVIVAINTVIFTYILYSVSVRSDDCLMDHNELYYQWRLAFLLFFMLGLTWSFGLLIQLDFGVLFVYLFTFSATVQGFVMFVFFIVFNKNTRILYKHYFRNLFSSGKFK